MHVGSLPVNVFGLLHWQPEVGVVSDKVILGYPIYPGPHSPQRDVVSSNPLHTTDHHLAPASTHPLFTAAGPPPHLRPIFSITVVTHASSQSTLLTIALPDPLRMNRHDAASSDHIMTG